MPPAETAPHETMVLPSGRSLWLDAARGAALCILALNHFVAVFSTFNLIHPHLRQFLGVMSMAEALVVISGIVCARVYLWPDLAPSVRRRRLLHRAGQIYVVHMITVVAT